jgi:hypothetical protein
MGLSVVNRSRVGHRDLLGIGASTLCVMHCVLPSLVLLLGGSVSIGMIFGDERVHQVLVTLVASVALWSLVPSLKRHGRIQPLMLALPGVGLLVAAVLLGHDYELLLSLIGSFLMIGAHTLNRRDLLVKLAQ